MPIFFIQLGKKTKLKNFVVFTIFYIVFFSYYYKTTHIDNLSISILINSLILLLFIISVISSKFGLYTYIFLIPLLNTLTTILSVRPISILLLLFFSFFLGFLVYSYRNIDIDFNLHNSINSNFIVDSEVTKAFLVFFILILVSASISIFRYSNFYPFITNNYHNLIVNINGQFDSNESILWVINFFFNYVVGFLFLFSVFNILRNNKEIITAITIIIASTILSSLVAFYQYLIDPYIGSSEFWVSTGRLNATFTDPNSLGSFIILLFPIFIMMIIISRKIYLKIIFGLLLIPFMLMIAFSGSRNALLGILIAVLLFVVFGIFFNRFRRFPSQKSGKRIAIKTLIIFLILIIFISLILGIFLTENVLKNKILNISLLKRILDSSKALILYYKQAGFLEALKSISNYRYIYWNQAIHMAKDYPITGIGTGSYIIELPDYLYKYERSFTQIDYSGNYYLQILAELGIPGLFLILFLFFLFIKRTVIYFKIKKLKNEFNNLDWVLISLFISFITMLIALFFGPHTNFIEIQMTLWLIIGLIMAYIKLNIYNDRTLGSDYSLIKNFPRALKLQRNLKFDLKNTISIITIVLVFTISFLISSLTSLSITAKQDVNNWANNYGFCKVETIDDETFRWTGIDASEVVEKNGNKMIIPMKDAIPVEPEKPLSVKIFVDNLLVKKVSIEHDKWTDVQIDIPDFARERFTLTLTFSRSWSPKEIGLNPDTRELGIRVGEYRFID